MCTKFLKRIVKKTLFVIKSVRNRGIFLHYAIIFKKEEAWLLNNITLTSRAQGREVVSALIATSGASLRATSVQNYYLYTSELMEQNLT